MCIFVSFLFQFSLKADTAVEKESTETDDNNDDCLITLEGCNQITKWHFPKDIKQCPALKCKALFSSNSDCRDHFKKEHAKHSICCPECNKPYASTTSQNFSTHFRKAHPEAPIPFKFDEISSATASKSGGGVDHVNDIDNSKKNANDDIITLNAKGIITKWHVPADLLKCPVFHCKKLFETRSNFICHFMDEHAKGSIFCEPCNKPLRVGSNKQHYIRHYKKVHPTEKIPFALDKVRDRTMKIIHRKLMVCVTT